MRHEEREREREGKGEAASSKVDMHACSLTLGRVYLLRYTGPLIGDTVLSDCERLHRATGAGGLGGVGGEETGSVGRETGEEGKTRWWGMPHLSLPRSAFAVAVWYVFSELVC